MMDKQQKDLPVEANEDIEKKITELLLKIQQSSKSGDFEINQNKLQECAKLYIQKEVFKTGDKVVWKEGLKNRKLPQENQFGVVVDVLSSPIFDDENKSSGSPYFREPLDIRVAVIDEDDDVMIYYYDSRRFRKIEE